MGSNLVTNAASALQHFVLITLLAGIRNFYSFMCVILMLFLQRCQLVRPGLFLQFGCCHLVGDAAHETEQDTDFISLLLLLNL